MDRRLVLLITTIGIGIGLVGWQGSQTAAPRGGATAAHAGTHAQGTSRPGLSDKTGGLGSQVDTAVRKAAQDGNYACCIRPACAWCLLHGGRCTCAIGVGSGRGACRECHGGWEAGQGRIPGRTRQDVRNMKTFGQKGGNDMPEEGGIRPTASPSGTQSASGASSLSPDGQKLFAENNCLSCHKMEGKGGTVGPDLTHEAQRHADVAWQVEHLKDPTKVSPGSTMPSYAKLSSEELSALGSYLAARK